MPDDVIPVSDETFQAEVLDAQLPTVVDFWAEWCGPCRKVSPILEELAGEYTGKVRFAKFNVDESSATPTQYAIMSIPTVMLFKDGKMVDKLIGARGKGDYQSWIDSKV